MDDNTNGPMPGILGQDGLQTAPADGGDSKSQNEKIFDSSKFTGETSSDNESFVPGNDANNAKLKKEKKPIIFVRWYFWAILTGLVAASAAVIIFVLINSYEGRIRDTESVVRYDNYSSMIDVAKNDFEEALVNLLHDSYGITSVSSYTVYPSADEIRQIRTDCLGEFNVKGEDIDFVETRKSSGAEMMEAGENIGDAQERLGKIVSGYNDATAGISACREIALSPVTSKLEIKLSDEITETSEGKLSRKMTVKNNGDESYSMLELGYEMQDSNGISQLSLNPGFWGGFGANSKQLKPGDEMEFDLFVTTTGGKYYSSLKNDAIRELTPKLVKIRASKVTK